MSSKFNSLLESHLVRARVATMTWSRKLSGGPVNSCLSITSSRWRKIFLLITLCLGSLELAAMLGTSSSMAHPDNQAFQDTICGEMWFCDLPKKTQFFNFGRKCVFAVLVENMKSYYLDPADSPIGHGSIWNLREVTCGTEQEGRPNKLGYRVSNNIMVARFVMCTRRKRLQRF